jgi:hypothetical protein
MMELVEGGAQGWMSQGCCGFGEARSVKETLVAKIFRMFILVLPRTCKVRRGRTVTISKDKCVIDEWNLTC